MPSEVPIFTTLVLMAMACVHVRGWHRVRVTLPNLVSLWRPIAFLGGIAFLWIAVASPLRALDHRFLTAHMTQHLLLMTVAAPLILLGAPFIVLWHAIPQRFTGRVPGPFLLGPLVQRIGSIVTHPVLCWLASTAVVIGWHVPALFELGMRSAVWHNIEHISFLVAGLLFWWPVILPWPSLERWPRWRIPLYLFLATLPCDALSAFLAFCNRVVYVHYQVADQFDPAALGDQEGAGALMWVCVTFAYLTPAMVVTLQLLSPGSRASQFAAVRRPR